MTTMHINVMASRLGGGTHSLHYDVAIPAGLHKRHWGGLGRRIAETMVQREGLPGITAAWVTAETPMRIADRERLTFHMAVSELLTKYDGEAWV